MHPDLESLLKLQEHDRAVMHIEKELDALKPEVAVLDTVIAELESTLARAERFAAEVTERRETLEGKIESYRVMQDRRRQKLEWVRGGKEAATLMAEIDLARSVLAKEEAEWMRSADEVQNAEAAVEEARAALDETRAGQEPRRVEIDKLRSDCEKRLELAGVERETASGGVRKTALARYERIRKGRAPLALYPLHGGACGHCYTTVPLHVRQQLQQTEGADTCEACGVLMYLPEDGAPAK